MEVITPPQAPGPLARLSGPGNHQWPRTLPMAVPADLAPLLAALLAPGPSKRPVMFRPRPPYLPHPLRRLARLPGVVPARTRRYRLDTRPVPGAA